MNTSDKEVVDSYPCSNPNDPWSWKENSNHDKPTILKRKCYPPVSHPNKAYEDWLNRRATFTDWSEVLTGQNADELASAGFVYEGEGGRVKCPW